MYMYTHCIYMYIVTNIPLKGRGGISKQPLQLLIWRLEIWQSVPPDRASVTTEHIIGIGLCNKVGGTTHA